ncbi:hypothetical protein TEA_004876 [Camellia sinensis var. sinensis]|uniref:AAA+ ATPase domain-containing protein n=1 Tax=Camellia sinensis var. sinensis TaxID=542762 RepID=A0A4S4D7A4_CAMSN|nr:hypothetical protein TEA_004876 [Camellia sinensis var. sinensis]
MGRRRRGGGSPPSTDFERVLRRHIESCNRHKYATVDEIVKRIDASEERLQRLENQHIRRKRIGIIDQSSSSSELESESAGGAVSTSEDAIYGEKLEPEFDLMKSMLRASYSESKDAEKLKENVEVELVVNNKADDKVKEKDGPRFRDLGGISGVVEELKMEVIVPLYHPQLLRWLGVRPMAGILLHGPPGCGKTKLAHAIANGTGVPFYKKLVSGVSAKSTPGFVGADLVTLANKAGILAMKRIIDRRKSDLFGEPIDVDHTEDWWRHPWLPEEMENLNITMAEEATKMVQPSSRREGFSAIPNVKWEDVRGLHLLRKEFDRYIVRRIKYPKDYEVDALTTKRRKEGGCVVEWLLNQLLTELDGADQRHGVYVIGATNRPDVMDCAVLQPGRFGKLLYVPLPSPDERGLILKALARKKPIDASVDLIAIGSDEACENLSEADLSALMNEAAMAALEEKLTAQSSSDADHPISLTIKKTHFEQALKKISLSVSDKVWELPLLSSKTLLPSFVRKLQNGMRVDGVGGFQLFGSDFIVVVDAIIHFKLVDTLSTCGI